jgi:hypothetical protein
MQEYRRRSHSGIGLGEHLIVATALTEGLELAPLNVRHYPCFPTSASWWTASAAGARQAARVRKYDLRGKDRPPYDLGR